MANYTEDQLAGGSLPHTTQLRRGTDEQADMFGAFRN
uniref:Uncharacterized protein n=1 Tax=Glossina morsitans morsitans TaxID=37546 RepID=A0A1B0FC18_GLOMM